MSDESTEAQKEAESLFDDQISTAHDDQWAMRVADSIGQSAAGTAASFLNPALGMSLMYSQTFQASRAEYKAAALERGLDVSDEAADRYAHEQAMIQTPFELVGDVAIAKAVKGIFKSMPAKVLKSGPETFGHWIGEQSKKVAKSTAGEVLITTPSQTIAESLLAEGANVRDATTWGEKGLSTLDAMSIALGQSGAMGGGSLATVGGIKTLKGDFDTRTPKPNTADQAPPQGVRFDPEAKAEGYIEFGGEAAGIRFSKADDTPSKLGREWLELAQDESTRQFGPNSKSKDLSTILGSVLGKSAADITIRENRAMNGSIDGFDFVDDQGGTIKVRDFVENGVYLDTSEAGKHRTGIYQSIYIWAHNTGRKVIEDPGGMSYVAQLRRTSQMLSSALRLGTTKHMEPGVDGGIDGWLAGDSHEATAHNIGLLALKEAKLVKERLPELDSIRYDSETQSFTDGEYRIPDQEVANHFNFRIGKLDSEFSKGVGPATLRRALATYYSLGRSKRSPGLMGIDAKAPESLQRIRYALSPFDFTGGSQDVSDRRKKKWASSAPESGRGSQNTRSGSAASGGEPSAVSGRTGSEGSRSEGVASKSHDVSRVEGLLDDIQARWGSKLDIVVHPSVREIADGTLRNAILQEGKVEGFFNPNDRKIHIIADRVRSAADAERLLRHEGLHWAFAGPLKKQYAAVIEKVGRDIPWERMQEIIAKYPKGAVTLWIEECLAARGEKNPDFSLRRKFYAKIREILREVFGEKIKFSDAELDEFLYKANRRLERAKASDSQYFDAPDESADPLYAKGKPKGPQRASWDEVRKGDLWNSVKKFLPKEKISPPIIHIHGSKDNIVNDVAEFLKINSIVTDWTGRTVYLPYGQTKGNYGNPLLNRAEHLTGSEVNKGAHDRELNKEKARWVAAIPITIKEGAVRVRQDTSVLYFKNYNGVTHMVVTSREGLVQDQIAFDSGLVSQYTIELKWKEFPAGFVESVRHTKN